VHRGKVIKAADYAAWAEGRELLESARRQAAEIAEAAKQAFEEERQRGFEEGVTEARLEAAEQMVENVSRTIDYFASVEGRMVELVMSALRKILADFSDQDRVVQVVKKALAVVRNQKQVVLRVPPAQVEPLRQRTNELLAAYPGIGFLDIVPDARLGPDGCILETDIGSVDASIEVQLQALRRAFEKSFGSGLR